MNAEISETVGARLLRFDVQIPELLTQRKFVSAECHAHSNLGGLHEKISKQALDCRGAQHLLEDDVAHKESSLGIDSMCHQLNNHSRGITYYGGIEKFDPSVSTQESWAQASSEHVRR